MALKDFLPKKLKKARQQHSAFIDETIKFLQETGFSIQEGQMVAQIADVAARGQSFVPLLTAAQEAVQLILEKKLHPVDALLAAQLMALLMKSPEPQKIVDGAKKVAEMYHATGFQQNLFTTDMSLMGQKLTEALGKMGMNEIKVDSEIK